MLFRSSDSLQRQFTQDGLLPGFIAWRLSDNEIARAFLAFRDFLRREIENQSVETRLGKKRALFGSQPIPFVCFKLVHFYAHSAFVALAKFTLRRGLSLSCRLRQPPDPFLRAFGHYLLIFRHVWLTGQQVVAEPQLGVCVSLFCCSSIPFRCFVGVARHAI